MKNIVICCDGTSNEFGKVNTNVLRLVQVLEQSSTQLVYYQPGVGTMPHPGLIGKPAQKISKLLGLAFGAGLVRNVLNAYRFLMDQWEPGDNVFLFGFSRGAYTIRVLAGMLYRMGLLRPGQTQLIPYAIRLYRALSEYQQDASGQESRKNGKNAERNKRCDDFRHTFSRPIPGRDRRSFPVHFIGAWDTVSSVGWVWNPKVFAHTSYIPSVEHIRHAVALDERRAFFRQNRFSPRSEGLVERWFAGSHCDVGGGSTCAGLWPFAFEWMLQEAMGCGIRVHQGSLAELRSAAPSLDELKAALPEQSLAGYWWLAEAFPKWRYDWVTKKRRLSVNLGRARRPENAVLDRSVAERIQNLKRYRPLSLSPPFIEQIAAAPDTGDVTVPGDGYRPAASRLACFVFAISWALVVGAVATLLALAVQLVWSCWFAH